MTEPSSRTSAPFLPGSASSMWCYGPRGGGLYAALFKVLLSSSFTVQGAIAASAHQRSQYDQPVELYKTRTAFLQSGQYWYSAMRSLYSCSSPRLCEVYTKTFTSGFEQA